VVAVVVLAARADAQSPFDYISFDGVDYVRWAEEPGRSQERGDLGPEFGVVTCSFGEDTRSCPYGTDAGAAYMPAGTRIHAVRGYATDFRLAAVWRDRIFLYQAWRNPRARVGGNLFDIAGKVRAIDAQRGEPASSGAGARSTIAGADDVEALVSLIMRAPVRRPSPHATGELRYWLTFWLADGTTLGRPYFPESGELLGGVVPAAEFRALVERHFPE
jgi:hypothetical protein